MNKSASSQITLADKKPKLSFWQMFNMSFGFLGTQYAFALQTAYMGPIYTYLDVDPANIPFLLLAGPITGLVIQPIVGALSDKTWSPRWGRRRPYFLIGAILASICLVFMPFSSTLWMAAGLLWILDSSINVTMEPFRAFIADKLPEKQRSAGFSMQTFFIGGGQILAMSMAIILVWMGFDLSEESSELQKVPDYVRYPFFIGAFVFMASVLWTIFTTDEYPPEDVEAFKKRKENTNVFLEGFKDIWTALWQMPKAMKQLFFVKFFTWYGIPIFYSYLALSIARHVYNAPDESFPGFAEGVKSGTTAILVMNVSTIIFSLLLPKVSTLAGRRLTHAICLLLGAVGFIGMLFTTSLFGFLFCMCLFGATWASALTMPYVMLSSAVPADRMGIYMGLFNTFIVIPMAISMVTVPLFYDSFLASDPRNAIAFGGAFFILAALATKFVGREVEIE
ncbi:MFS transporter [Maribacter sp. 2210JD10-5]|uniref:MFS transporter n=1 Tax=Maribacter sp. 2210JD10-5 TaxID=3386272 RepID=UPI0039BD1EB4